jgi:hypothetical protein
LCVIAWRSSGSLRRAGRGAISAATAAEAAASGVFASTPPFASSFEVDSGWLRLQPSR